MEKRLRIGEVSERTDVSVPTIRYYEDRGLIPEPPREESSGYRAYPVETVHRIRFIRQAQELGFTLREIEDLLNLRADCNTSCAQVREVAQAKLREVEQKIEEMISIRDGLRSLTGICPGDLTTDCPILEVLEPCGIE
jgi:MerR family mercuric resistance operon transcriptional regulator